MERTIGVERIHCAGCEQTVEEALRGVQGVTQVTADQEAERAAVARTFERAALVASIEEAGYRAKA